MSKIEIKSIFGKVIFEYECENNSIRKTVEKAIEEKIDLSCSDLSGSNLSGSKNKENSYLPLFCRWQFSILGNKIQIGCKTKNIEEWDLFFASNEEYSTPRNTEDFKQIQAIYLACKAYLTHLKN